MNYPRNHVRLPGQLAPLRELASNLRWSWHPPTQDLFDTIDRGWRGAPEDPNRMLNQLDPQHIKALVNNKRLVARISALSTDLHRYLHTNRWYQAIRDAIPTLPNAIACVAVEFGRTHGCATEFLRAASDLGLPVVALGLRRGADTAGGTAARPLTDGSGRPVLVSVDLPNGRTWWAQVWQVSVGRIPLLLLDTDIPANAELRAGADRIHRALLVGFAGAQAIRAYCEATGAPWPELFHCIGQESALLCLDRAREVVHQDGAPLFNALATIRANTVFNRWPNELAGADGFDVVVVRAHLAAALGGRLPLRPLLALGGAATPGLFELSRFGERIAGRPGTDRGSAGWPFVPSVHGPSWEVREVAALVRSVSSVDGVPSGRLPALSEGELWHLRRTLRSQLVRAIRPRVQADWLGRGVSGRQTGWISHLLDPNRLTVGAAGQPMADLLASRPDLLSSLVLHHGQPIQLILVDVPEPTGVAEKAARDRLRRLCSDTAVRNRIVFLPTIDLSFARELCAGVDVWINGPSTAADKTDCYGPRAALNGALSVSFQEGWWQKCGVDGVGWVLDDPGLAPTALFDLLTRQVAPAFYSWNRFVGPGPWSRRLRRTLAMLRPAIQETRVLAGFVENNYRTKPAPTANNHGSR